MKTVTGRVISEEPISLSKAATLLSRFVSSDNGASQAVSAYLRRTSAAFTELNSIHNQNKSSSLKEMKPRSDEEHDGKLTCESDGFGRADDIGVGSHFGTQQKRDTNGIHDLVEKGRKIAFRKSETGREKESVNGGEERQGPKQDEEDEINVGKTKKKKKKKKKSGKNKEEDDVDGKVTQKLEGGDKATEMETEDEQRKVESKERKKKKKKKRKSDEEMGSEEKRSKKKSKLNEIDG